MKDYIVRQNDISDCGACCLASIIKYYKGFVPLEIIKIDTLTTNEGTNFYNLKEAAIKYGFEVIGYDTSIKNNIKCPYIAQLKIKPDIYHFVVVYKVLNDTYVCMDPAVGIKKYSKDEFNSYFTGNILKLYPINKIIQYNKNNHFKDSILKIFRNNSLSLFIILLLSILSIGISLLNTYSIKLIINNNIKYLKLFIMFLVLKNLLNYIKDHLLAHLNKNVNISLIKNYINHFFFLPFKYLQFKSSGEITSRINDLNNIKDFFTKEFINIIVSIIILIGTSIIMFYLNKYLTIFLILISIIFLFINYLLNNKSFNYYLNCLDSEAKFLDQVINYVNGLKTIKNLGKENFFLNRLNNNIYNNYNNSYTLNKYLNKIKLISSVYNDLGLILILLLNFNIGFDNILIYILYYNYFIDNINYYSYLIPNLSYFKSIITRINGIYYLETQNLNNGHKIANNSIEITNLYYNYNLSKVFDNFNISISRGDKILIKGNNGVGKTTLLNIINGNIDDYKGRVEIGNRNIKEIDKTNLKRKIIYTGEIDTLFEDTILDNIILDKSLNKNKLLLIENILQLKFIINKKANGYNTLVKDNLSRGERQIIILARSLYQDADILLLDESLSEVNYKLRRKIVNNINNYYKDKTIIYVSHNLEEYPFNKIINLTARKE